MTPSSSSCAKRTRSCGSRSANTRRRSLRLSAHLPSGGSPRRSGAIMGVLVQLELGTLNAIMTALYGTRPGDIPIRRSWVSTSAACARS